MEPVTTAVMAILGKYMIDSFKDIVLPKIGKIAKEKIGNMCLYVLNHIANKDNEQAFVVSSYKKDPETYEKPLKKILNNEICNNEIFKNRIIELIEEYNSEIDKNELSNDFKIDVNGNFNTVGSIFGNGNLSVGGDIVGGNKV